MSVQALGLTAMNMRPTEHGAGARLADIQGIVEAALDAAHANFRDSETEESARELALSLARARLMELIGAILKDSPIIGAMMGDPGPSDAADESILAYIAKVLTPLALAEIGVPEIAAMLENNDPDQPLPPPTQQSHDPFDLNHISRASERAGIDSMAVRTLQTLLGNLARFVWSGDPRMRSAILEYWAEQDFSLESLYAKLVANEAASGGALQAAYRARRNTPAAG